MHKQFFRTVLLFFFFVSCFTVQPVFAQSIVPTPTVSPAPEVSVPPTTDTLTAFFSGFDWLSSGLVFHTPDVFTTTISLRDGTILSGLDSYRNSFFTIATPLFAVLVAFFALQKMGSDNPAQFRSFGKRLLVVTVLFLSTPTMLSVTIQGVNLLNDSILHTQSVSLSSFVTEFLKDGGVEKMTAFSHNPFLTAFFSPGVIIQVLLLVITFGFLLIGFLYIIFQSVIRFAALLFLSVLFPLILPFALSEKTEHIPLTYFRMWCSFLIQQPAFVLGFAIATTILSSLLKAHPGSIGLLFLYSGLLFFLGTVNVLVTRLFAESWAAAVTNLQAAVAGGAIVGYGLNSIGQFKRGALGGGVSGIRSYTGQRFGERVGLIPARSMQRQTLFNPSVEKKSVQGKLDSPVNHQASFAQELAQKGLETTLLDRAKGTVSVRGMGYAAMDTKSGLRAIYASKEDGISDGVEATNLKPTTLKDLTVIDLSSFHNRTNPYNASVTTRAKQEGMPANTAHVTQTSSPDRVQHFLQLSKDNFAKEKIEGVVVKRYGNNGNSKNSQRIVRIYTQEGVK